MDQILMQWRRRSDGTLVLFVKDDQESGWRLYYNSKFYRPDFKMLGEQNIRHSYGFRTAQHCLSLGGRYLAIDESLRGDEEVLNEAV